MNICHELKIFDWKQHRHLTKNYSYAPNEDPNSGTLSDQASQAV